MVYKDRVAVDGGFVPCCRFGDGKKTMVILPGISMTGVVSGGEAVADVFRQYTEEYTVYLFDRPSLLPQGTTVRKMAKDTAAAMRALGIRQADVLGTSQGGMMALALALDDPDLVHAAALASTQFRPNETSRETFRLWLEYADRGDVPGANRAMADRCYSPAFREKYRAALEASFGVGTAEDCRRFGVLCRAADTFEESARVASVRCPVFAVGGEEDRVLSVRGTRELIAALRCEGYVYPAGSHAAYDEEPDFRARLLAFFRSVTSAE